jgi:hypothetical protein
MTSKPHKKPTTHAQEREANALENRHPPTLGEGVLFCEIL